jgi:hypothetical protein
MNTLNRVAKALAMAVCSLVVLADSAGILAETTSNSANGVDPTTGTTKTTVTRVKGPGVSAFFSSWDAAGCVQMDVPLFAYVDAVREVPEEPTSAPWLHAFVSVFDHCTGQPLLVGEGITRDFELWLNPELTQATLRAPRVAVGDQVTGTFVNLSLDLAWTGDGDLQTGAFGGPDRTVPGVLLITTLAQRWREGQATGTILAEPTLVWPGTANLTPEPSVWAQVTEVQTGSVVVHMK